MRTDRGILLLCISIFLYLSLVGTLLPSMFSPIFSIQGIVRIVFFQSIYNMENEIVYIDNIVGFFRFIFCIIKNKQETLIICMTLE